MMLVSYLWRVQNVTGPEAAILDWYGPISVKQARGVFPHEDFY